MHRLPKTLSYEEPMCYSAFVVKIYIYNLLDEVSRDVGDHRGTLGLQEINHVTMALTQSLLFAKLSKYH